ncbi:MAG: VOC family protein [Arenibacter sp.]
MKITQIYSYLTFNGNCREAMTFYQECLGGNLQFRTLGESLLSNKMPKNMKDCILHATLTKEYMLLQGSDMAPHTGLIKGNTISLYLGCSSEEEIKEVYKKLSADGTADHPLADTFWGTLFGNLTDKFGNHWLLNYRKE